MTSPRNLLLIALLFIGYLMWMQWQEDYHRPPATTASAPATHGAGATSDAATPDAGVPAASVPGADVPATEGGVAPTAAAAAAPRVPEGQRIVVTTDVLRVEIDTRGGNVVVADLLDYARDPKHPERVRLLGHQLVALAHADGIDQHHVLAAQLSQGESQVMRVPHRVHGDAQNFSVNAQLLVSAYPVAVGCEQCELIRPMAHYATRCELGGSGGFAYAGRPPEDHGGDIPVFNGIA